jgi:hypothetical protein
VGTKVTFTPITAGFASADQYNANFDTISDAFDTFLSRDGVTPNTMTADLDMNSNDILNANIVNAVDIVVAGTSIAAQVAAAAASAAAAAVSETNAATSETNAAASAAAAAALTTFLNLTDVPASYSGQALLGLRVNAGETALEFASASATVGDADYGDITVSGSGTVWSIDAGAVDTAELATNAVITIKITDDNVTIAKIAAADRTGADLQVVTGTAGTLNYTAKWNTDGDLVDGFEVLDEDDLVSDSATKLATQQSIKAYVDSVASGTNLFVLQDQQASGSAGGSASAGTWQKRTLNTTVINGITGASVASSVVTLPAGTYYVRCSAPGWRVNGHAVRLRNTTDASTAAQGMSVESRNGTDTTTTVSEADGYFTIAGAKTYELQHWCETARTTDGLGKAVTSGEVEVYGKVFIQKVA